MAKPKKNFKLNFQNLCINDNTLDFFKEQIVAKKTKNNNTVPGFLFQSIDGKEHFHLPLNYTDIDNRDFDSNNFFLFKLEPSASATYIFDSPIEMLFYHQIYHHRINNSHQFICFLDSLSKESISSIVDIAGNTKIFTVFNKNNLHGNINDIRFALVKKKSLFKSINKNQN